MSKYIYEKEELRENWCFIHDLPRPCARCNQIFLLMAAVIKPPEIMRHPDETDAEFKVRALAAHRAKHAD